MLQSESSDGQMQIVICFEYGFENVRDLVWSADDLPGDHLSGNLQMSGNLTAVREMSGILLKVGEKSC